MTVVTDRPSEVAGGETARLRGRIRNMTIAIVVMAVALIGLGAWVVYDIVTESDTAVSADIETLLDDYTTAWNSHDGDAFRALVADNYVHEYAGMTSTVDDVAANIETGTVYQTVVEKIGEPIQYGDGPYIVAQANHLTSSTTQLDGISVFTIVQNGDAYMIQSHVFIGS